MDKTILIVDDSFSLRQTISMALKSVGYQVVEASDGQDALSKLDGRKYNLIISDVNMPNLDGLSFVRAVKQTELQIYAGDHADHRKRRFSQTGRQECRRAGMGTQAVPAARLAGCGCQAGFTLRSPYAADRKYA